MLPLHYAAAKGAPLDVSKLLLEANLEAVNAADKVPRRAQAAPPVLPPRHVPPFFRISPPFAAAVPPAEAAPGTYPGLRCVGWMAAAAPRGR